MKGIRLSLIFLLMAAGLALPARGVEEALWDAVDTQALEEQGEEAIDVALTADIDLEAGLSQLGTTALEQLGTLVARATRSGGLMLAVSLFCALAEALTRGAGDRVGVARLISALAVTAVALEDISSLLELGRETVEQLNTFTALLIPCMTTAAAASGSVTGAAARQMATLFCSNLLLRWMEGVLIPLVYLYVAACAGGLATGNGGVSALAGLIRRGVQTLLTWVLLLFTLYLSISGVLAGTADRAAVKVARFAISGMVPVVGGILSDATESVLAGAEMLKNAIGVFGALAVLGFCLIPFLRLGIQYLLYQLASALASVISDSPVSRLIGEIGGAVGLVLGMVGASAMITLVSILVTVATAVG